MATGRLRAAGVEATVVAVARKGKEARLVSNWELWLSRAQRGDAAAYRCFLDAAAVHLRRRLARSLPAAEVDDLVQDILLAVHVKRDTYDPRMPLLPWLNAIARYKWIDWLRARGRATLTPLDYDVEDERQPSPVAGPAVRALLEKLPTAQAEAIRYVKLAGYSIEETSQATGQSVSLVKVNVHRGLKRLMALLRE